MTSTIIKYIALPLLLETGAFPAALSFRWSIRRPKPTASWLDRVWRIWKSTLHQPLFCHHYPHVNGHFKTWNMDKQGLFGPSSDTAIWAISMTPMTCTQQLDSHPTRSTKKAPVRPGRRSSFYCTISWSNNIYMCIYMYIYIYLGKL